MTKKSKSVIGGPKCPKCQQQPWDLVRWVKEDGKPPLKQTIWYCSNRACNTWGEIMEDDQVWLESS